MKQLFSKINSIYKVFNRKIEKYLVLMVLPFFVFGIILAKMSSVIGDAVHSGMERFIDGYSLIAPLAIFIILTPSLSKMISTSVNSKFAGFAILWLSWRRFLATFWAVFFTVIVFDFPLLPQNDVGLAAAIVEVPKSLGSHVLTNSYFIAMYSAVAIAFISLKIKWLYEILEGAVRGIELFGKYFQPLIPLFMLAIGAYVYTIPTNMHKQFGEGLQFCFSQISIFGFILDPNTVLGMVLTYTYGSVLVGVACFAWHFALLVLIKIRVREFTFSYYFKNYWCKVYPLLWATSSEALATPLNLYLVKKYFPNLKDEIRRFVVGMGCYLNINGTLICVFILGGLVAKIMRIEVSLVEWLLAIPLIFLIGYGVPGIPGELVLFAGPLALLLNIPETILPVYLAVYIGLQIGLPDAFRTGVNSTDDCACAILLDDIYKKKYERFSENKRKN